MADDLARNGVEDADAALPAGEHHVEVEIKPNGDMVATADSTPVHESEQPAAEDSEKPAETQENEPVHGEPITEAQAIRNYLAEHGTGVTNRAVIEAMKSQGFTVSSSQVSRYKATFSSETAE